MASGHVNRANRPNTWLHRPMLHTFKKVLANSEPSTHDPRTSCHGAKARICLGLGIVVNPPEAATCSDAVKADDRQRVKARIGPRPAKRRLHSYLPPTSKTKLPLSHASLQRRGSS